MKQLSFLSILIFPLLLFSQDTIPMKELFCKNGIYYLKKLRYSGIAIAPGIDDNLNKIENIYAFKNGLFDATIKNRDEIRIYKSSKLYDYTKLNKDGSIQIHISSSQYKSPIKNITYGIFFDNQIEDKLYYSRLNIINDSIEMKYGAIIELENGKLHHKAINYFPYTNCDVDYFQNENSHSNKFRIINKKIPAENIRNANWIIIDCYVDRWCTTYGFYCK